MLTDRQKAILQILVDDYIRSAEPVGSRTLSKRSDLSISPATIRNEMADLEELGYLEQPHTSAGRVPSQKGYRFYVDHLLTPLATTDDVDSLRRGYINKMDQMEQVVQHTATILSSLTNYTSIVLGPQMYTTTLRHIQLVPLHERSAVAIIVADNGHVENRKVTIPEGIPVEMIQRFVEVLNKKLTGVPLHRLKGQLRTEVASELRRYSEQYEGMMMLLNEMLTPNEDQSSRVYLGGTTMILNQPEFRDVAKLKPLLDMFEQTEELLQALGNPKESGIIVRIGQENMIETFHDCSLITASYAIDGQPVGTIGVLGPTRMDYGRVIAVMGHLSATLSGLLTRLNK
jgi:heat-inducible transcriptional repressor